MDKRQYNAMLDELKTLPVPGTILYPPKDKVNGDKLLRYEIDEEGIKAIMQFGPYCEGYWLLEQVRMCTWDKN